MRLAAVTTAVVLMTGVYARADMIVSPATQQTSASATQSAAVGALEMALVNAHVDSVAMLEVPAPQVPAQASAVTPEPSTMVLMSTGIIGPLAFGWRRRRAALR